MNYLDYQAEQEALQRRRAIADQMFQGYLGEAQRPTEYASSGGIQMAVPTSPLTFALNAFGGYRAGRNRQNIGQQELDLAKRRQGDVQSSIQRYQQAIASGMDKRQAAMLMLSDLLPAEKAAESMIEDALRPEEYGTPVASADGRYFMPSKTGGPPKLVPGFTAPPPKPVIATTGVEGDPTMRQTVTYDPRSQTMSPLGRPYQTGRGVNVNVANQMPPEERTYDQKIGGSMADQFMQMQEADRVASERLMNMQEIDRLLTDVYTGTGGNQVLAAQKLAQVLGMPSENISSKEAALAMGRQAALQLRNPAGGAGMPGAMSDQDRRFLESMVPNLEMTADGRKLLVEVNRRLALRAREVAALARRYAAQNDGRLDVGFYDFLEQNFEGKSLFTDLPMFENPPTMQEVQEEMKRRGLQP